MNEKLIRDLTYAANHAQIPAIGAILNALAEAVRAGEDEIEGVTLAFYNSAQANLEYADTVFAIADPCAQPHPLRQRQLAAVGYVLAAALHKALPEIQTAGAEVEQWGESTRDRLAERAARDARMAAASRAEDIRLTAERLKPWEIVRDAEACGVALTTDDSGAIRVSPPNRLGTPHVERIDHRRAHVVAFLQERQAVQTI